MSEEEFEDIELSYKEQDSLNKLSEEEMETFNRNIELYIQDPEDSKHIWFLTDNLIEFADNLIHLKNNWPDNFDKVLLKNRGLLEEACKVCKDKTVLLLLQESIQKIEDCLARMTDAGYFIGKTPSQELPFKDKHRYPYYKYKNRIPPKTLNDEIGKRLATHLLHRYDPHYENNETDEELTSVISEISLVTEGVIPQPKEELFNPKTEEYLLGAIQKLRERSEKYQSHRKELTELSNKKVELTNQKDNLKLFREQLLMKCIDQMIVSAKE